jgi:16S rRNA C1402 N4-methylase RsmH
VSDSYDPEFGTGANAHDVAQAIRQVRERVTLKLGPELHNIVAVAQGDPGRTHNVEFTERELRVIRFALNRALETI